VANAKSSREKAKSKQWFSNVKWSLAVNGTTQQADYMRDEQD